MRRPIEVFEELGNILTRHRGKANVVFCDGHVEVADTQISVRKTLRYGPRALEPRPSATP